VRLWLGFILLLGLFTYFASADAYQHNNGADNEKPDNYDDELYHEFDRSDATGLIGMC
jgi:hypothetical protein